MRLNEIFRLDLKKARCILQPAPGWNVSGIVDFEETPDGVIIEAKVLNLPEGKHGFHVHEKNECEGNFESAGGHYNPYEASHGAPDKDIRHRHVGDFGNLKANEFQVAKYERIDDIIALRGPRSIIGLSVVIHEHADDLVTQPTGGSGARIACGIIRETQ